MSYTITHYDGKSLVTVNDGTVDTTLDLKIIGKSYAGYGLAQNENFVYLLENFSNRTPPAKPIPGQIWYDSLNNKLKFYDVNTTWRTIGGSTATATSQQPTNLTVGEFWFDTDTNRVYIKNNTGGFTLVGGSVATGTTTQMQSVVVKDTSNPPVQIPIIQAITNGKTVFVISSYPTEFQLDSTTSAIDGFNIIHPGITLYNTPGSLADHPGQTQDNSIRFWGTASNSELLGGLPAGNFIQAGNASFSSTVNFSDVGYTLGSTTKLRAFVDSNSNVVFQSTLGNNSIKFQTKDTNQELTPLVITNSDVTPGTTNGGNLGTSSLKWNNIYANYVYSTSQQADTFLVSDTAGLYKQARVANLTTDFSIVARDASGNINVSIMNGTATQANSLQLSGSPATYLTANTIAQANSIAARDNLGNLAVTALSTGSIIKTGSSNAGTIGQSNNVFANIYSTVFTGNLLGNVTGNITGSVTGSVIASTPSSNIIIGSTLIDSATNKIKAQGIQVGNGTAAAPSISFISDSNQNSGFYWSTNGSINISNAGVLTGSFSAGGNLAVVGNMSAVLFQGTATSARYADLAEKYLADKDYEIGTVVRVGGDAEVTATSFGDRAIGAVSQNPAYMMNSELEGGTYIALKGRIPVKVIGTVRKGQRLIAANNGCAVAAVPHANDVFAIAMENSDDISVKLIECVIL